MKSQRFEALEKHLGKTKESAHLFVCYQSGMHSEKKNKRLPQPRVSEQTECLDDNKGIAMSEVAKRNA